MDARRGNEAGPMSGTTTRVRRSERELVVTRTIKGPPRLVFEAFTKADLFKRWWVPKSFGIALLACETDVRVGGKYRLAFANGDAAPMEFFGKYIEVTPPSRLAWTNEEGDEGGPVTTVTFEDDNGNTRLVVHDLYPSKQALDDAMASGGTGWPDETLDQLDELVTTSAAGLGEE